MSSVFLKGAIEEKTQPWNSNKKILEINVSEPNFNICSSSIGKYSKALEN